MSNKRKVVVIGLGSIGRRHARLLAQRGDVTAEVCEPSQESLSRARPEIGDLVHHATLASALASRPQAVVIATPHALHAEQTVQCLQAGVHVLCEKPMAHDLASAQRMLDAAKQSSCILSIGFHLHFASPMRRIKELIDTGALGRVIHVHSRVGTYITLVNSLSRYQRTMEGALLYDYAHQPDALNWWLGRKPRGVYTMGGQAGDLEHTSNPNYLATTIDYEGDLLATIHLNYVQMPQRHEYEVVGDKAWARLDLDKAELRIGEREKQAERIEHFDLERDPHYQAEHQAFFDAIDGKRAPESPAEEGIVSMQIIDASLRSLKSRARVSV